MTADGSSRGPKRDPYFEAYEANRARRTRRRDESSAGAAKLAAEYHEAGITPRFAWTLFAMRRIQELRFLSAVAALAIALAAGHWRLLALLLLTWIPASRFRGYVGAYYLLSAVVFVMGIALGLPLLAVLGVLIPRLASLAHGLVMLPLIGLPREPLIWDRRHAQDPEERERGMREHKLAQWRKRMRAKPLDARVLEQVALDMRDWDLTPSQAVRVASQEGVPPDLIEEIVRIKLHWPDRREDAFIDEGWKWERLILR